MSRLPDLTKSIATLSRAFIVLGMTLLTLDLAAKTVMLTSNLFGSLGARFLNEWALSLSGAAIGLGMFSAIIFTKVNIRISDTYPTVAFCLMSFIFLPGASVTQDISWDGIWYHLHRVMYFIKFGSIENLNSEILTGPALLYPLLPDNLRGLTLRVTAIENPFSATALNISMAVVAASLFYRHCVFLEKPLRLVTCLSPVTMNQALTLQVDGFVASIASIMFLLIILAAANFLMGASDKGNRLGGENAIGSTEREGLDFLIALAIGVAVLAQSRASFYFLVLTITTPLFAAILLTITSPDIRIKLRLPLMALLKKKQDGIVLLLLTSAALLAMANPYGIIIKSITWSPSNYYFSHQHISLLSAQAFDTGTPFPMDLPVYFRFFKANIAPPTFLCLPQAEELFSVTFIRALVAYMSSADSRVCGYGILSPAILISSTLLSMYFIMQRNTLLTTDSFGIQLVESNVFVVLISMVFAIQVFISTFFALGFWARINPFTYSSACLLLFVAISRNAHASSERMQKLYSANAIGKTSLQLILATNIAGPPLAQSASQYANWQSFKSATNRFIALEHNNEDSIKLLRDDLTVGAAVKLVLANRERKINILIVGPDACSEPRSLQEKWVFPPLVICR